MSLMFQWPGVGTGSFTMGTSMPMNVDGAAAVVYAELGFPASLARGLFVLSIRRDLGPRLGGVRAGAAQQGADPAVHPADLALSREGTPARTPAWRRKQG
ncbi:citrate synthase family protein [Nonomuraea phyllanthi]|uniref:hypothetical protein n=1 Tax=Nonomuraea phyllanthi TaxID=2219224 RepID=UPI001D15649C|nr:hypothetical protein [Nonomuraea phyllanthi]